MYYGYKHCWQNSLTVAARDWVEFGLLLGFFLPAYCCLQAPHSQLPQRPDGAPNATYADTKLLSFSQQFV